MINEIRRAIITGLYVGFLPKIPGTFGSILAFPIIYLIIFLCATFKFKLIISGLDNNFQEILGILSILLIVNLVIFIIGVKLSDIYVKKTGREDPKEIVIDEISGQMLTVILSFLAPIFAHNSYLSNKFDIFYIHLFFVVILPFVTFRFFDIIKPWPIDEIDKKVKGGLGIMIDDIVAAIFASIMTYAITFVIIGEY